MKLTQVQIDNFLGVSSVNVRLTTPITMFCGPNGAGKSSLQEAVRLAFTRDDVRDVKLKKEYGKLVHEGSKAGGACIFADGGSFGFNMPAGEFTITDVPESMRIALHGQRFASMTSDERRTFLFDLTGCAATPELVRGFLTTRSCDADKIEAVLPMIRSGFPSACEFAKQKATDAKGAWRGVTGETFGSKKADGWKAEKPAGQIPDCANARSALDAVEKEISDLNQQLGSLTAEARAAADNASRRSALKERADRATSILENLSRAQTELAEFEPKVVELRARAKGVARAGLIHDLARALSALVDEAQPLGIDRQNYRNASNALERYEEEHGEINTDGAPDLDARASLPEHERGLQVLQNRVKNLQRDLGDSEAAKQAHDALAPVEEAGRDIQTELQQAQARIGALKASRDKLHTEIRTSEDLQRKFAEADEKTKKAGRHYADVMEWTAIAEALAPDGIPGELLSEALKPINSTLQIASNDTGWMRVAIDKDMNITAGGREYSLLSESEKWRVDAMIAQTVAKVSKLKILMLDRVDVLDNKGRIALLTWLDELAEDGHIDTALLFATLKAMPSGLPATISAHWIENGAVVEYKAAA